MSKLSTEEDKLLLGLRLMTIRTSSGLTQFEFADRLGLSPRAYANYERGEREMPVALFKSLCDSFRIDPLWLLVGPGEEPDHIGNRRVDLDLLEEIIRMIEEWLVKKNGTLKPEKKARVIRLAYEHCVDQGAVDAAHLKEMLSLAA